MDKRLNIGAHISIAGGIDKAPLRGKSVGCECIQIFTRSNRQWFARDLPDEEVQRFKDNCRQGGIAPVYAHNCYLINLGAPDEKLRQKSQMSFAQELERAEKLGLPWIVAHPGSHGGSGEEVGLERIAAALNRLLDSTRGFRVGILVETTAGQGTSLGGRFEHLASIISRISHSDRIGVCLDTCHVFAAGYDIRTPQPYRKTFREFDRLIGLDKLKAFHLNDSTGNLGSGIDRHEHIGHGKLGKAAFRLLLRDRRFRDSPKFLETPKGVCGKREWNEVNLATLRKLASD